MNPLTRLAGTGGNSAAAMLLALNFILLSFFIVLVSIASAHSSKKELALAGMAAEFRAHDEGTPQPAGAFLPHTGSSGWQTQVSVQVLGMVSTLLAVATPEMETEANRLVVKLPLSAIFNGGQLTEGARKAIPNLLELAANTNTRAEVWLVSNDAAQAPAMLAALDEVADSVPLGLKAGEGQVQVIYRAVANATTLESGATLNRLSGEAAGVGGAVHGEGR